MTGYVTETSAALQQALFTILLVANGRAGHRFL
jgi:hypothetical protein